MNYRIRADYSTGNSFGSHEEFVYVELKMPTIEIVEENLKRLVSHHRAYQEFSEARSKKNVDQVIKKYSNEPWFVPAAYWNRQVRLLTADGGEFIYYVPWQGYFEHLRRLSIEVGQEDWTVEF